jgi:tetratricopeptide (TPR) repeat protein
LVTHPSSLIHPGVFFLLAQGRLYLSRSQPARAIACYQKAMSVQSQYRHLHHHSFWEMAVSNLALWEIEESLKCWRNLHKESTVRTISLYSARAHQR